MCGVESFTRLSFLTKECSIAYSFHAQLVFIQMANQENADVHFFPTIRGSVVPHSTVFNMFSSQIFIYRGEKIHNLFLRLDSLSLSKVLELINYPSNLMTTTKSVLKVVSGICWCKKAAVCRADHQQKIA